MIDAAAAEARRVDAADAGGGGGGGEGHPAPGPTPAERVDALLDWLEANRYLSSERFVESRVNARSGRFGDLRIRQELRQHGLALPPDAQRALADTELQRAQAVRERKFTRAPLSAADRARQARFLAGRGFSTEAIRRALRDAADGTRETRDIAHDTEPALDPDLA